MSLTDVKINKYMPFAIIYFFCNSIFLPEGLLYTTLLTPILFYNLIVNNRIKYFVYFLIVSLFFLSIHLVNGVNIYFYLKSYFLLITVYIFLQSLIIMLSKIEDIEFVFSKIIYINAFLVPIALVFLKLKFLDNYFWYYVPFTPDFPVIPRLKMFTYEASYYSLLLVPLFFYVLWNFLFQKNLRTNYMFVMIVTPLLLSFSLGVLSGIAITILLVFISNVSSLIRQKRAFKILTISLFSIIFGVIVLFKFFPNNALVIRIKNIPTGKDTSARGRTYEAFDLANKIARKKSVWFGVGLGQIKEMGRATIVQYYQYTKIPETIRIPNAVAETYAIYGIVGLIIRFGSIIFLFFKTRVFQNYFRLSLFVFVFIYQFTGSFIFNIVEYVIWILAFSHVLPQFNKGISNEK